jgi:hypothetical protein
VIVGTCSQGIRRHAIEISGDGLDLERSYEGVISIEVSNDLETAIQRDDLALDMLLQYTVPPYQPPTTRCLHIYTLTPIAEFRPLDKTLQVPPCSCCP